jgi:hypothetical protein
MALLEHPLDLWIERYISACIFRVGNRAYAWEFNFPELTLRRDRRASNLLVLNRLRRELVGARSRDLWIFKL